VARAEPYLLAKFHFDPSNRLATVHQQTDRQDRRDRQDNGPIAIEGQPFLQMVAPKSVIFDQCVTNGRRQGHLYYAVCDLDSGGTKEACFVGANWRHLANRPTTEPTTCGDDAAVVKLLCPLVMAAVWNRAGHYSFALWFLLSSIVFSSPNLIRHRLDVYHTVTCTHDVALVRIYDAGLKCATCGSLKYRTQINRQIPHGKGRF